MQVVPNETVLAVDVEGADALPAQLIEDEFKDQYGQPLNFARVEKSRHTIDNWYRDRHLDGLVSLSCLHKLHDYCRQIVKEIFSEQEAGLQPGAVKASDTSC